MIKPSDCNFMFCFPITQEDFQKDKTNLKKDFIRNLKKGKSWKHYEEEISVPYLMFKKEFSRHGFVIHDYTTFDDFAKHINDYKINIVFSHCDTPILKNESGGFYDLKNQKVEFFDRLVGAQDFLDVVSDDYDNIIDLSVCKPIHIAQTLKLQRKNCIVKSSNKKLGISMWLYIYSRIFEAIRLGDAEDYSDVIETVILKIREAYEQAEARAEEILKKRKSYKR